ncbi:MAG: hypothetical protein ACOYCE_08160 [Limnochordia bacterium]|jgi:hypothetical protein
MQIRGIRVEIILIFFLAILGLLFSGQQLFYRWQVLRPLEESFRDVAGVEEVNIERRQGQLYLEFQVAPVENLRTTYLDLVGVGRELLGDRKVTIHIKDTRDPFLSEVFYDMHFTIAEGIATGRFARMAGELEALVERAGLEKGRFYVDEDNVYVQLTKDDAYLYEIIPRTPTLAGLNGGARG